jgi:hypothetical protein
MSPSPFAIQLEMIEIRWDATFYTWRSKYGGLEISEMRRLRQLEE